MGLGEELEPKLLFEALDFAPKPRHREELGSHACQGGDATNFGVGLFVFRRYLHAGVRINIIRVRRATPVSR